MPETTPTMPTPAKATRRWPFLALGASAFAVLMTVGPIVATRGVDAGGSEQDHAGYNVGMMAARSAISTGVDTDGSSSPAAPTDAGAAQPIAVAGAPPTAGPVIVEEGPAPVEPPIPLHDGAIDVSLELLNPAVTDGDTADWMITITNQGDEYLWGVYAYLEGFGAVSCDDRQLTAGSSTACRAEQIVWAGDNEAVAWATAWTVDTMAEEETNLAFTVGP